MPDDISEGGVPPAPTMVTAAGSESVTSDPSGAIPVTEAMLLMNPVTEATSQM